MRASVLDVVCLVVAAVAAGCLDGSPRDDRRSQEAGVPVAPDGEPAVLMVQKRDGGYGYDTTDLATLRYRVRDLKADRILYVVDARQSLHFRLIFEVAKCSVVEDADRLSALTVRTSPSSSAGVVGSAVRLRRPCASEARTSCRR